MPFGLGWFWFLSIWVVLGLLGVVGAVIQHRRAMGHIMVGEFVCMILAGVFIAPFIFLFAGLCFLGDFLSESRILKRKIFIERKVGK